ncbi:Histidinol-phosphate aminotransferase protein [Marine Group I thaumarchaeote SCGC AAA799-E16]|uniref:Histidinol-phosphate aminotransferase protein n=2 Tax=Marine Group I TaxID=905826 RepID=A0A087RS94_9ARCH|nr:Histidinol-phosphate aminotransferase protein [Marine Group I thaumarchaeote SCGC AAA799-E16]KFM16348.1 Histidinol-phosphate aminotransferase protein [Marine Group I thaumarchaeote SCGC RSA3]
MKNSWYEKKLEEFVKLGGYKKPEKFDDVLKLDSNENFVINKKFQQDVISYAKSNSDVREYPLGGVEKLVSKLSKYLKVPENMIGVGNGSDQILDLFLANMASKKTRILTSDPAFGFFEERCKLYAIPCTKIPFSSDMKLDIEKFYSNLKKCQILYLDSPNNPTGFQFSKTQLESLIKKFDGLVIIDEAYGEFGDSTTVSLTKKYDNLIVVKTFSKAFGLAGLRLGYFVANKKIVEVFNQVLQYPYPLNTLAIEAGIASLDKVDQMKEASEIIKSERKKIIENLRRYDAFTVFDSKANFVLFDAKGVDKRVFSALVEQGISIRKLGKIGSHSGCLRVTVGTKEMNSKFLLAIRDLLG